MPQRIDLATGLRRPRLIVTDLDRTTLTHDYQLLPQVIDAVRQARTAGILVAVATARSTAGLRPWAAELGISGTCVCLNGAWIGTPAGECVIAKPFPSELGAELLARTRDFAPIWYTEEATFAFAASPGIRKEEAATGVAVGIAPEGWHAGQSSILKVLLNTSDAAEVGRLRDLFTGDLDFTFSNTDLVEVTARGVTKGAAVLHLAELHSVPLADVAVVGDSENDLSMFAVAGQSVAMGNAPDRIREMALFEAPSVWEAGLATAIRSLVAAKPAEAVLGGT